ncbi:MAG TPA: hypothetical protein VH681_13840, partial [Nitrospiraceae bacterium]
GLTYGLMFDNRGVIAKRLGLRVSKWTRHIIGFGTEPIRMPLERVLRLLSSVFNGPVVLRYTNLAGMLMSTAGELVTPDGIEKFGGYGGTLTSYFLQDETYRYEPWDTLTQF